MGELTIEKHRGVEFGSLHKGFVESGVVITDLLSFLQEDNPGLSTLGPGVLYRYGPNALPTLQNNLVFTISSALSF